MTNKQFLFTVIPLVGLIIFIGFCVPKKKTPVAATTQIKRRYAQQIRHLDSTIASLKNAVATDASPADIQRAFRTARMAYKNVEFLVEYYNPYTAKAINGAAIDEVEADDPNEITVPPTGFQVVEELLFPEYATENKPETLKQIGILASAVNRLKLVNETTNFTDSQVFDAMRLQVYRILVMGISGFDSPIALYAMPETAESLRALHTAFAAYQPDLTEKAPQLTRQLEKTFTAAIGYVQSHPDFSSFDRAAFITGHANPLSALLLDAQDSLHIARIAILRPLSPHARTMFDANAFNADFFAPDRNARLTPARVELGKMLFFDPILSGNGSRSCASCHRPDKAFTDGQAKSVAFDFKGKVARNAPTLLNAGLQRSQFHDLRVVFLEDQASDVLTNATEMHGSMAQAVTELQQSPAYTQLFVNAFPGEETAVTERHLKTAIASYVRSLTSLNSRFDQYMRGDTTKLTVLEKDGFNLFMGKAKCGTCHFMPLFNGTVPPAFRHTEAEIIGVPTKPDTINATLDSDEGKFALYKKELHKFAFKTPTVRNAEYTAPYMHNGAYRTLEQVVDFYNRGGGQGIGIDLPTQTLPADPLNLTEREKSALVAFMHALTDTSATRNVPERLPEFPDKMVLNARKVGGTY